MQTAVVAVVAVVGVAMWLIRLPDIGNQTVRSKPGPRPIQLSTYSTAAWGSNGRHSYPTLQSCFPPILPRRQGFDVWHIQAQKWPRITVFLQLWPLSEQRYTVSLRADGLRSMHCHICICQPQFLF